MATEQVFSDHDSEDEVDDDIADFEDRRVRWGHYFALIFRIKYLFSIITVLTLLKCRCLTILLMLQKMRNS